MIAAKHTPTDASKNNAGEPKKIRRKTVAVELTGGVKGISRNRVHTSHEAIHSPDKKEPRAGITASDSKKFFDELFDSPQDLECMLDMPLIAEEGHQFDRDHDEDIEYEIK